MLAVGLFVLGNFTTKSAQSNRTNREVALACTTDMATQFHIHPHLTILINGVNQEIPANIGITAGCMNALHTHDANGELHVESPEKRDFNLSDFFAVWEKPFDKEHILEYTADATNTVQITVNGSVVDTYENTILRDKDNIVISYGPKK